MVLGESDGNGRLYTRVPLLRETKRGAGVRDMREPEMKGSPVRFPMEFSRSMQRAADRCADISRSERIFGYMMSWRVYSDITEECKVLPAWLFQEIMRMNGSPLSSFDDAA